jgi:hypothetical protein
LFDSIINLFEKINTELINFIASFIDLVVPNTLGLSTIILPYISNYDVEMYKIFRYKLNDKYDSLNYEIKNIINDTDELGKYILRFIEKSTFHLSNKFGENYEKIIYDASYITSYIIKYSFIIIFLFINLVVEMADKTRNNTINKTNLQYEKSKTDYLLLSK